MLIHVSHLAKSIPLRVCNSTVSRPDTVLSPLLAADGSVVNPFPPNAAALTALNCTFICQYESRAD